MVGGITTLVANARNMPRQQVKTIRRRVLLLLDFPGPDGDVMLCVLSVKVSHIYDFITAEI